MLATDARQQRSEEKDRCRIGHITPDPLLFFGRLVWAQGSPVPAAIADSEAVNEDMCLRVGLDAQRSIYTEVAYPYVCPLDDK